jgi:hypothetical protein
VTPSFAGISRAGVYQINLTVPEGLASASGSNFTGQAFGGLGGIYVIDADGRAFFREPARNGAAQAS